MVWRKKGQNEWQNQINNIWKRYQRHQNLHHSSTNNWMVFVHKIRELVMRRHSEWRGEERQKFCSPMNAKLVRPFVHHAHTRATPTQWHMSDRKKKFLNTICYSYPRDLSLPLLMIVYTLDTFNLLIREETYLSSHRKHLLVVVVVTSWVF